MLQRDMRAARLAAIDPEPPLISDGGLRSRQAELSDELHVIVYRQTAAGSIPLPVSGAGPLVASLRIAGTMRGGSTGLHGVKPMLPRLTSRTPRAMIV